MFTHDNFIFWLLGVATIAGLFTVYGSLTSRALPEPRKSARIRMFALIGLGILFFFLPIFKPYVSSYSVVDDLEIANPGDLNTQEAHANHEKDQDRNIERLKTEVNRLREDIDQVNFYYSTIVQTLSTIVFVTCLIFALRFRRTAAAGASDTSESRK
jgi:hypothetical protein